MRVLAACSVGGTSHLNSLLPFLHSARRRGDLTLVVAPESMEAMVEEAGFDFEPGAQPDEAVVAPIRELLPIVSAAESSRLGNCELFGRLATTAILPAMEKACAAWEPDLILREPCEYASAVVAARSGIPVAQVAISLATVEAGSIAVAAPALEEHEPGLVERIMDSPYLTRFPASLDPSTFERTVRWREASGGSGAGSEALPDWWGTDSGERPLVYVTFGTVLGHMTIAARVFRVVLEAVKDLDASVLLTVGRRFDPELLGPVPAHVHVESWVDQAEVFAHADLVVCHGGSGTAFGALGAGLPLVVVPVFADQFQNGRRIAAAAAGVTVEPRSLGEDAPRTVVSMDAAPRIAAEIGRVLGDPAYRQAARRIAAEMAAVPTADDVLAELVGPAGVDRPGPDF